MQIKNIPPGQEHEHEKKQKRYATVVEL